MQILKGTGIHWNKRRMISKLYMEQSVKSTTGPRGDKKCLEWKRSWTGRLSVTDSFQLIQLILQIQGGSNMTGTDLCVNKPHCAAAVRP